MWCVRRRLRTSSVFLSSSCRCGGDDDDEDDGNNTYISRTSVKHHPVTISCGMHAHRMYDINNNLYERAMCTIMVLYGIYV